MQRFEAIFLTIVNNYIAKVLIISTGEIVFQKGIERLTNQQVNVKCVLI
jgi:ABC-type phosphate/phosphonate transport system ATPase subunit